MAGLEGKSDALGPLFSPPPVKIWSGRHSWLVASKSHPLHNTEDMALSIRCAEPGLRLSIMAGVGYRLAFGRDYCTGSRTSDALSSRLSRRYAGPERHPCAEDSTTVSRKTTHVPVHITPYLRRCSLASLFSLSD